MSDPICTFAIPQETKEKLESLAESEHRSLSGQIRLIIEEYLNEKK